MSLAVGLGAARKCSAAAAVVGQKNVSAISENAVKLLLYYTLKCILSVAA